MTTEEALMRWDNDVRWANCEVVGTLAAEVRRLRELVDPPPVNPAMGCTLCAPADDCPQECVERNHMPKFTPATVRGKINALCDMAELSESYGVLRDLCKWLDEQEARK